MVHSPKVKALGRLAALGLLGACLLACAARRPQESLREVVRADDWSTRHSWFDPHSDFEDEMEISLGAGYLPELRDQQPTIPFPTSDGFGSFDRWGFAAGLGYHHLLTEPDTMPWWLGLRFGILNFDERERFDVVLPSGDRIRHPTAAQVFHLSASLRTEIPLAERWALILGGSTGYYELSVTEEDRRDPWSSGDRVVRDGALGGSLSGGLSAAVGQQSFVRLGYEIHAVRFDHLRRFTPGDDSLSGPLQAIFLAFAQRF